HQVGKAQQLRSWRVANPFWFEHVFHHVCHLVTERSSARPSGRRASWRGPSGAKRRKPRQRQDKTILKRFALQDEH
ncbi:hypothetical protein, partial [Hoeflea olei]|uniref:hypothetical protein n=1 Tax=Hoeflea olei TaxID=1480615 RepID=UPI001AECB5A2